MPMVRLIYTSLLCESCGVNEVRQILKIARENNAKIGVTGLLCYDTAHFIQWIEGARDVINSLYLAIASDDRHTNALILDYGEITSREFAGWSMAYVNPSEIEEEVILRYCPTRELAPFSLSAEASRNFMLDIARVKKSSLNSDITISS